MADIIGNSILMYMTMGNKLSDVIVMLRYSDVSIPFKKIPSDCCPFDIVKSVGSYIRPKSHPVLGLQDWICGLRCILGPVQWGPAK